MAELERVAEGCPSAGGARRRPRRGLGSEEVEAPPRGRVARLASLLSLAAPLFVSRVGWAVLKATDSALLGHVSTAALRAAALSDLWTSATGVVLTASVTATLAAQALGAGNKRLVGVWVQVSLAVQGALLLPVALSWMLGGEGLRALGAPVDDARRAGLYARTMAAALPSRTLIQHLGAFLSAQRIVTPAAVASAAAAALNLCLGLPLVLGWPIKGWTGFGFVACAWVTVSVELAQLAALAAYTLRRRLYAMCWPGWAPAQHVTRARVRTYLGLYVPAALSIASDFWRMSAVGALAASVGGLELAVFNASYRVLWIALIFTGSAASATGIVLSSALGAGDVAGAKHAFSDGTVVAGAALVVLCATVAAFPRAIAGIFSSDPAVLELFVETRVALACVLLFMNLTVFLECVPNSMGRTKHTLLAGLAGSWAGQVPYTYIALRFWRRDLVGLYAGVAGGYALACAILGLLIARADWGAAAEEARARSEAATPAASFHARGEDESAANDSDSDCEEAEDAPLLGL